MSIDNQLPPLPTPKFTETVRGVPCITVTEHEHLMRIYALQAIQQAESDHARLPGVLKDHQIAAMVNSLRDIARQFHWHGSLRERIANVLVPALKAEAERNFAIQLNASGPAACIDGTEVGPYPAQHATKKETP